MYDLSAGQQMSRLQYTEVRGLEGVKEAAVTIPPNPTGPLRNTEVRGAGGGCFCGRRGVLAVMVAPAPACCVCAEGYPPCSPGLRQA